MNIVPAGKLRDNKQSMLYSAGSPGWLAHTGEYPRVRSTGHPAPADAALLMRLIRCVHQVAGKR
jgi:hypothetical protein